MDFSETIAAIDMKICICRQLIEFMKVMKVLKVKVISLPYIFQVLYVLCFTRPRYQVSVYRTIGPLVLRIHHCHILAYRSLSCIICPCLKISKGQLRVII